jgi:hypothetical protein
MPADVENEDDDDDVEEPPGKEKSIGIVRSK